MTHDIVKTKWSQLGGKLQAKWSKLTDDDVNRAEGHREYLVDRLRERYGISREKADVQVKEFERALH